MTQFHHDDQNENRLNYFDLFRRFIELQNKINYCRITLFVDFNEKKTDQLNKNFLKHRKYTLIIILSNLQR